MNTTLETLQAILDENKDKKITVIGTTCIGKTTLLKSIPTGIEISDLAPKLTSAEHDFYYNAPLTPENKEKRLDIRARRALVQAGQPAFGTGIAQGTELIVRLHIDDELLKKRAAERNVDFDEAKIIQGFIADSVHESGLPVIDVYMKE